MKSIYGDLIELAQNGYFDMIIHGCNCFNTMGSGIAKQIRKKLPIAEYVDKQTKKGDVTKLGDISVGCILTDKSKELYIVNAYTQYKYGRYGKYVDYRAMRSCFKKIYDISNGKRIGYPLIGTDRGGGNWNIIRSIIDEELKDRDHTLVLLK